MEDENVIRESSLFLSPHTHSTYVYTVPHWYSLCLSVSLSLSQSTDPQYVPHSMFTNHSPSLILSVCLSVSLSVSQLLQNYSFWCLGLFPPGDAVCLAQLRHVVVLMYVKAKIKYSALTHYYILFLPKEEYKIICAHFDKPAVKYRTMEWGDKTHSQRSVSDKSGESYTYWFTQCSHLLTLPCLLANPFTNRLMTLTRLKIFSLSLLTFYDSLEAT